MNLYDKSSLILVPSGVKASKVYSQRPENGDGDFTFSRASVANRINENGVLEQVASNVPRLDYSDSSCPSLLLEPTRTNLITHSEYVSGITTIRATINLDNSQPSPTNDLGVYYLTATSANGLWYYPLSTSGNGVFSVYLKRKTGVGNVKLSVNGGVNYTNVSVTNEWKRFSISTTSGLGQLVVNCETSGDEVYLWGLQAEEASYATSYIPTYGTAVTRNQDTCTKTGISSLIGQEQGTIFIDFKRTFKNDNYNRYLVVDDNDSSVYRTGIFILPEPSDDGRLYISVRNNSTSVFAHTYNDTTNKDLKIAVAYRSGDIDYFVNGVKVDSSTTTFSFSHTLERIAINGSNQENNQILVFKTKLTDSECITLTTL